jgi:hypothetical protein
VSYAQGPGPVAIDNLRSLFPQQDSIHSGVLGGTREASSVALAVMAPPSSSPSTSATTLCTALAAIKKKQGRLSLTRKALVWAPTAAGESDVRVDTVRLEGELPLNVQCIVSKGQGLANIHIHYMPPPF